MGTSRRRYLGVLSVVTLAIIATAGALNAIVDPYGYFAFVDIPNFNRIKPYPTTRAKGIKVAQMRRTSPSALILGNSRAEIGFDPNHPVFGARGLKAYNAALPGTDIRTMREMYVRGREAGNLRLVVAGIEFLDFLEPSAGRGDLLPSVAPPSKAQLMAERLQALFSVTAVSDSLTTLRIQRDAHAATLTRDGFNPLLEYPRIAASEGYYKLFMQRAQENARAYLDQARTPRSGERPSAVARAALLDLLDRAGADSVEVHFVIYPYHAQLLMLLDATGLWSDFERWKADLVALVDDALGRHPSLHVRLWDFSGYHLYASEPVPAFGDLRTKVRWYWEAGHFKKELGDLVLEQIIGEIAGNPDYPGVALDRLILADHLAAARAGAVRYRSMDPVGATMAVQVVATAEQAARRARAE